MKFWEAMKAIEGPSGAFYRNQIKSLRNDVAEFQKDFFSQPKVKRPETLKTEKVGPAEIKEFGKLVDEIKQNPTPKKLEDLAEKTQVSKESLKEALDKTKELIKEGNSETQIARKVKNPWEKWGKRALTVHLMTKAAIYTLSGGEFHTLGQYLNERKRTRDVKKYTAAKDSASRQRVITELRAKGYTTGKIRGIVDAANAQKKLETSNKKT